MSITSNISEFKTYSAIASTTSKPRTDNIIQLYEERRTANFKTALNTVSFLIIFVTVVNIRAGKEYIKIIAQMRKRITSDRNKCPGDREDTTTKAT